MSDSCQSLALPARVTGLAVEVVKQFHFDELESRPVNAIQQSDDLVVRQCAARIVGLPEAAAEHVHAEGLGESLGPDRHAAIGKHFQFQAVGFERLEPGRQIVRPPGGELDEHIGTDQLFLFHGALIGDRAAQGAAACSW